MNSCAGHGDVPKHKLSSVLKSQFLHQSIFILFFDLIDRTTEQIQVFYLWMLNNKVCVKPAAVTVFYNSKKNQRMLSADQRRKYTLDLAVSI